MQIMEVGSPLQVAKEMLHVYVRSMIYLLNPIKQVLKHGYCH
jgi:hypothetical protein